MGAYTCEFNVVHKVCRCPTPHTIKCPTPDKCLGSYESVGKSNTHAPCYRMAKGLIGKHEAHPPHEWGYTSWGGGHYMDEFDPTDFKCKKWICPGRSD